MVNNSVPSTCPSQVLTRLVRTDSVVNGEPDPTKQLSAIDRYERRALSRRKFAIREFDARRPHTAA